MEEEEKRLRGERPSRTPSPVCMSRTTEGDVWTDGRTDGQEKETKMISRKEKTMKTYVDDVDDRCTYVRTCRIRERTATIVSHER